MHLDSFPLFEHCVYETEWKNVTGNRKERERKKIVKMQKTLDYSECIETNWKKIRVKNVHRIEYDLKYLLCKCV